MKLLRALGAATAAIGLSPQAASMRYLRAMRKLRELLGDADTMREETPP